MRRLTGAMGISRTTGDSARIAGAISGHGDGRALFRVGDRATSILDACRGGRGRDDDRRRAAPQRAGHDDGGRAHCVDEPRDFAHTEESEPLVEVLGAIDGGQRGLLGRGDRHLDDVDTE